ncbi:PAS domain S-box protein [Desulfovibrio inopinatus]|uniref:PAS domain S-box protein n=1 Tax=Desulfovibrio inopinatus TaxID=102109 RepID=UPI000487A04C|nr:PAS domain-containing sensor histidine kinase [Desulfovibrio inopinatus]
MKNKLRMQAEALANANEDMREHAYSYEEMRQIVHELHVHQIELEMQNEELRRSQAELDVARTRYFDLYDLAPVGYCTISEQGLVIEANLTIATMLGLARNDLVGKPWTRFIYKEDQDLYYQQRKKLFETALPASYDLRLKKKDGSELWVHVATTIAKDADSIPSCRIAMHDISDRKQEEEFREGVERIIQHDIKGPLINLFSLAQLVINDKQNVDIMQIFPQIILGIRQIIHLINAVEPLRKMEKGVYIPSKEPIDIEQVVKSIQDSLTVLSSKNEVAILLQVQPSSECQLYGEAFLIEDMLMNLMKNAVEASPKGERVTISCQMERGKLRITIHNMGVVPAALRKRFFEKYATEGKLYGTGLGTYSAQLIANAHGGSIGFTTSEAEGTTITVILPCGDRE